MMKTFVSIVRAMELWNDLNGIPLSSPNLKGILGKIRLIYPFTSEFLNLGGATP